MYEPLSVGIKDFKEYMVLIPFYLNLYQINQCKILTQSHLYSRSRSRPRPRSYFPIPNGRLAWWKKKTLIFLTLWRFNLKGLSLILQIIHTIHPPMHPRTLEFAFRCSWWTFWQTPSRCFQVINKHKVKYQVEAISFKKWCPKH